MFLGTLKIENIESYDPIQYFLNSSFRIKILLSLYDSDKTVKELKKELDKTESNVLHYLKDLEDKEIVDKFNDEYSLTSIGYLTTKNIIKRLKNWNSLNKNSEFLNEHVEMNLPLDLILNQDLMINAEVITSTHIDYNYALNKYKELVSQSKNLKVILPLLSNFHLQAILETVSNNEGQLDLITSKFIVNRIYGSELGETFKKLEDNNQIKIWYSPSHQKLNKFITCSESFVATFLFFDNGNCDDSKMLLIKDKDDVEKLNVLIDENKLNF